LVNNYFGQRRSSAKPIHGARKENIMLPEIEGQLRTAKLLLTSAIPLLQKKYKVYGPAG